jgi:hypothetical protein
VCTLINIVNGSWSVTGRSGVGVGGNGVLDILLIEGTIVEATDRTAVRGLGLAGLKPGFLRSRI